MQTSQRKNIVYLYSVFKYVKKRDIKYCLKLEPQWIWKFIYLFFILFFFIIYIISQPKCILLLYSDVSLILMKLHVMFNVLSKATFEFQVSNIQLTFLWHLISPTGGARTNHCLEKHSLRVIWL